ncbi:MAG: trigger factor [Peptococcaceae bacterium]|nr:trigger factor [Peptococcaceae bacterium]
MGFKLEMEEKNRVTLQISVDEEKYERSIQSTLKKLGRQVNIPGFRKGKAPRHMVERHVGKDYILDEAAQPLIAPAYFATLSEAELDPIAPPEVDFVQVEEGQELIFTAKIQLPPDVELGAYLDLAIDQDIPDTTEEQVEEELKRRQESYARMVVLEQDIPAEDGDTVNIDFVGYKDGIAFTGGTGEDVNLVLGSGTFIPGFEEQLIGAATGESVQVNVTFPEEYHQEDLRDQPVVFEVTVNSIKRKELVPLDDEFAKDVSEFDTLEEYRQDIKKNLAEDLLKRLNQERRAEVIKIAVENAQVDIPLVMVESRYQMMVEDMKASLSQQGMTLGQYCQYFGMEPETFMNGFKSEAEKAVKSDLVLDAIAEAEDIAWPEDDFMEQMKKVAEARQCSVEEVVQRFRDHGELLGLKKSIRRESVVKFLISKNLPDLLDYEKSDDHEKSDSTEDSEQE